MIRRAIAVALVAAAPATAQVVKSDEESFRVVTVVERLDHPWGLAFLPDGRMLVTERAGRLRIVGRRRQARPAAGRRPAEDRGARTGRPARRRTASAVRRERPRLSLVRRARRRRVQHRGRAAAGWPATQLENVEVIYRQLPKSRGGRHFGSRLVFDRAGFLYITQGDRGEQDRAQSLGDLAGKVVRLHDDGRVPKDNPFAASAGARPEIFTLGNRNVQGAALHPATGELWSHEHGPQGGDEVNVLRAGVNYGWPVITYGANYGTGTKIGEGTAKPGLAQPLHYWVPSIAPSGMAFYTGDRFPRWQGDLFVGALRDQLLVRLRLDGEKVVKEERMLQGALGRIRDVRQGPDGFLYLLVDSSSGAIVRLEPAR